MLLRHSTWAAVFVAAVLAGSAVGSEPSLRDLMLRLEAIEDRIELLDQRLLQVEELLSSRLRRVDEHGIIRDIHGRPIGVWGIDINQEMAP